MADRDAATAENWPSPTPILRGRSLFPWTDPEPHQVAVVCRMPHTTNNPTLPIEALSQ